MKITSTQSSLRYSQSTSNLLLDAVFLSPLVLVWAISIVVRDSSVWWAAVLWLAFAVILPIIAIKYYTAYKGEIQSGVLTVEKKKVNGVPTYMSFNISDIDHFVLEQNNESSITWSIQRKLCVVKKDRSVTLIAESSFSVINPLELIATLFSKNLTVKQAERLAAYAQRPLVRK